MDGRERWQALQARLTAARAAADAGDRAAALAEVTGALEIDGDFLAAHALRDHILSPGADAVPMAGPRAPSAAVPPPAPPGPPPGYATFEQRAKRRRVDRRIDAARAAIEQQHLMAAAAALDEVIELDPTLPELAEMTARFDELRREIATPRRRGPWIAAAAVFVSALFGGTWLQDSPPLPTRQIVPAAPLEWPPTPIVTVATRVDAVGTTARGERDVAPAPADPAPRVSDAHAGPPSPALHLPAVPIDNPPPAPVLDAAHAVVDRAIVAPVSTPIPPIVDPVDDSLLVKQALQRYRAAYDGLDAQSARAVWPAVNQAALARAFDGLESQSLTFDACDVRLRGEAATATCHGSARYVTKVGSRDPRVEPRVWNFSLHKAGADWTIDSARAER